MSKYKETVAEKLARLQRESGEAGPVDPIQNTDLVEQITHEADGEPDFSEIAGKLEERKAQEAKGENEGYVKMTIYIREDIAASFNALITKRGQQKEFANHAFKDFVVKKIRELGLDQ
jgi:hypothetical protein